MSHLPDELWLAILGQCDEGPEIEGQCAMIVVLGNLSVTSRRLRRVVGPLLERAINTLLLGSADDEVDDERALTQIRGVRLVAGFLYAVSKCAMLVHHVRAMRRSVMELEVCWVRCRELHRFDRLRPFGQKVLRSLGVSDHISEWHSLDGWVALLLLILPRLEHITWAGAGTVEMGSPLCKMVDIARRQSPQRSFRALKTVVVECRRGQAIPDALKWDFLVLPSVESIQGPSSSARLADRIRISPDGHRLSITTFQSGRPLPMHLLEAKFGLMPIVRAFHYTYALHHNGGYLQMMALTHSLRLLSHSLEELSIEPTVPATRRNTINGGMLSPLRSSPHLWKRSSIDHAPIGNLGDATWLLGSLTAFERLRVLRAPRTALYDPRYVVALKHILPRSLCHLDVSPGPPPHKLDAAMLTTQLVAMVRSKPDRFPKFARLNIGDHTALLTPLLRDICAKFGVEIESRAPPVPSSPTMLEHIQAQQVSKKGEQRKDVLLDIRTGNRALQL